MKKKYIYIGSTPTPSNSGKWRLIIEIPKPKKMFQNPGDPVVIVTAGGGGRSKTYMIGTIFPTPMAHWECLTKLALRNRVFRCKRCKRSHTTSVVWKVWRCLKYLFEPLSLATLIKARVLIRYGSFSRYFPAVMFVCCVLTALLGHALVKKKKVTPLLGQERAKAGLKNWAKSSVDMLRQWWIYMVNSSDFLETMPCHAMPRTHTPRSFPSKLENGGKGQLWSSHILFLEITVCVNYTPES